MRKISVLKFLLAGEDLKTAEVCLDAREGSQVSWEKMDGPFAVWSAISQMRDLCKEVGARETHNTLAQIADAEEEQWLRQMPRNSIALEELAALLKRDLEDRVFFYMPADDAQFYKSNTLLSAAAKRAFPDLHRELRTAGTAHACGLPTASVFHCMRALEHALKALAADVGLTWEKEQWHNIIEMIEAKIAVERKTLPKGLPKDERLNFLSRTAMEFMYFKESWRNYVSHNRRDYSADDALEVMEHVQAFTERICAGGLKE